MVRHSEPVSLELFLSLWNSFLRPHLVLEGQLRDYDRSVEHAQVLERLAVHRWVELQLGRVGHVQLELCLARRDVLHHVLPHLRQRLCLVGDEGHLRGVGELDEQCCRRLARLLGVACSAYMGRGLRGVWGGRWGGRREGQT